MADPLLVRAVYKFKGTNNDEVGSTVYIKEMKYKIYNFF